MHNPSSMEEILNITRQNGEGGDGSNENSSKKSLIQKINHGLLGILYLMAKEVHVNQSTMIALNILNTLQLLYFPFAHTAKFPWNESLDPLIQMLNYLNFGFFVHHNLDPNTVMAIFTVVTLTVLANIFVAGYVAYSFSRGNVKMLWMLSFLRQSARLTTTVLFMPLITLLLISFSCTDGTTITGGECGSIVHILLTISCGIILIIFISFTALTVLVFVDRDPTSTDVVSSPHGRVGCFIFLLVIVLDVLFVSVELVDNNSSSVFLSQIGLAITVFIVSMCMVTGYLYYLPFYNLHTNKIFVMSSSVTLWTSVCLFFSIVVNDTNDFGPVFLLIGGMPLFMFFMNSMVTYRVDILLRRPLVSITSPLLAEVKLRLEYQQELAKFNEENGTSTLPRNSTDPKRTNMVSQHLQRWREAVTQFPSSAFLHFQLANVYNSIGEDKLMGGRYFRKASQMEKSLDQYFIIFQNQRLMEETQAGGLKSMDALSYIAFEHHFQEAKRRITDTQRLQVEFWKMLLQDNVNMDRSERAQFQSLFDLGAKVHKATSLARYHLDRLVRVSGASPRALRLYATFVEDVLNDPYMAQEFRNKADQVEEHSSNEGEEIVDDEAAFNLTRNRSSVATSALSTTTLFSNKAMMATISGEEENLGEIMAVSDACCQLYGYKKLDLLGKNISTLCPHPFDTVHDQFLRRYFDTGKPHILNSVRMVFGLHQKGYIFPVNLQVSPCPANDGRLMFMGQFKPILSSNEFILMDEQGVITSCTKGLFETLALHKSTFLDGSASITDYFPETILSASFTKEELQLSLPYSPRDEMAENNFFQVLKMPVKLTSDSKNEPYEISMVMLKLKQISSTCSVTTDGSTGAAAQPLGFMESNEHSNLPSAVEEAPEEEEEAKYEIMRKKSAQINPDLVPARQRSSRRRSSGYAMRNFENEPVPNNAASITEQKLVPIVRKVSIKAKSRSNNTGNESGTGSGDSSSSSGEEDLDNESQGGDDKLTPLPGGISSRRHRSSLTESLDGHSIGGYSVANRKERLHQFHRIIETRNKTADPHVQRLKRIFIAMIITFTCVAVSICVISIRAISDYTLHVQTLQHAIQRSVLLQSVVADIHAAQIIRNTPLRDLDAPELHFHNFSLLSTLEDTVTLGAIHDIVIEAENGDLSYSSTPPHGVELWSLEPDGKVGLTVRRRANLMLGVHYLVSNARKSVESILEGEECELSCEYVVKNGVTELTRGTIDFLQDYYDQLHSEIVSTAKYNIWSIAISSGFLLLAIVNGFYPVVKRINGNKDAVARAFKLIPQGTVKSIMQECVERLQENQAGEGSDAFDEEGQAENERLGEKKEHKSKKASAGGRVVPIGNQKKKVSQSKISSKGRYWKLIILHYLDILGTVSRLGFILLIVMAYFVGVLFWDESIRNTADSFTHNSFLAGERLVNAMSAWNWAMPPVELAPGASYENLNVTKTHMTELVEFLYESNSNLAEGNLAGHETAGELGRSSDRQKALLFKKGCIGETCDYASGDLQQGLHLGFETFLQQVTRMVQKYEDLVTRPVDNQTEALTVQILHEAVDMYTHPEMKALQEALQTSLTYYLEDGANYSNSVITMRVAVVILFVVGLNILYLFVYRTSIRMMEMELKHTRAMLLMVPGEVFEKVNEMRTFIKDMQAGKS